MLNLTPSEIRVIHIWAEKGETSPFPQEMALLGRIKNNISNREMKLTARDRKSVV